MGTKRASTLFRFLTLLRPPNALVPISPQKTAVITGGNTGLGKETAVRLAQLGADVTIACRNPDRAFAALEDIKAQAPGAQVGWSASVRVAVEAGLRALETKRDEGPRKCLLPAANHACGTAVLLFVALCGCGVGNGRKEEICLEYMNAKHPLSTL